MTQALNKPRANVKAMLDDWLAGDTGGLGIIRNASLDTAMHLELGTLSPTQAKEGSRAGGRTQN